MRSVGRKSGDSATFEERAEFSASLIRIGAVREARELLQSLPARSGSQADLFLAFSMMHEWDYSRAAPLLRKYIREVPTTDYMRKVAAVNLSASLVFLREHEEAEQVLDEVRAGAEAEGLRLLLMNTLELSAQNELTRGNMQRARQFIEKSVELSGAAQESSDGLYIQKWLAVIRLAETKASADSRAALMQVRARAEKAAEYEVVRDCDFQLATVTGDEAVMARLYYGTPYESYRTRVEEECVGFDIRIPTSFEEPLGRGDRLTRLNISNGESVGARGARLKPGQVPHRLLIALARDFYKPPRIAEIFSQVFPDQHFNPYTSPKSVHQALARLRIWFSDAGIPLDIAEEGSRYRLQPEGGGTVRLLLKKESLEASTSEVRASHYLGQIRRSFPSAEFTAPGAAFALDAPLRTTQLLLKELVEQGLLTRTGKGRATSYRLISSGS